MSARICSKCPGVHKSLDVINPNAFVSDDASFTLSSDRGKV